VKVIIAGSREFKDYAVVVETMEQFQENFRERSPAEITEVVSGGAQGADRLGERWSREVLKREPKIFRAQWEVDGKLDRAAGYKRNAQMADYADALVAFWDQQSRGTKHMIGLMAERRKPHMVVAV
jgi:predicted Rossmann-fold nucleotide-binding protein